MDGKGSVDRQKRVLRQQAKAMRRALGEASRAQSARRIRERLADEPRVTSAGSIVFYSPIQLEVDVAPLMTTFLSRPDVKVLLPFTDRHVEHVSVRPIESLDDLEEGPYGIWQPRRELPSFDPSEIDVVIVPALMYDLSGFRLGYGSGFYDRLLSRLSRDAFTVGVQYNALVRRALPVTEYDVPVHCIVTEERRIEVKR